MMTRRALFAVFGRAVATAGVAATIGVANIRQPRAAINKIRTVIRRPACTQFGALTAAQKKAWSEAVMQRARDYSFFAGTKWNE